MWGERDSVWSACSTERRDCVSKAYNIFIGDINFLVVSLLSLLSQYIITLIEVSSRKRKGRGDIKISIYKNRRINKPTVNKTLIAL